MDELRTELQRRLTDLEARAGRIEARRRAELPADSEEQATDREGDEVVDALDGATRAEIDALRGALARLAAGTYGTCESCGVAIPKARLLAMPGATRCVQHG